MKKRIYALAVSLIVLSLATLFPPVAEGQTPGVAVTATLTNGQGQPDKTSLLHFELWNCGSNVPQVVDSAPITALSLASNIATITAANDFTVGEVRTLAGLTTTPALNGYSVIVLPSGLSATQFQARIVYLNIASGAETGTASGTGSNAVVQAQFDMRANSSTGVIAGSIYGNNQISCGGVTAETEWLVTQYKTSSQGVVNPQYYCLSAPGTFNPAVNQPCQVTAPPPYPAGFVPIWSLPYPQGQITGNLSVADSTVNGFEDMLGSAVVPVPATGYCREYYNLTLDSVAWIDPNGNSCGPSGGGGGTPAGSLGQPQSRSSGGSFAGEVAPLYADQFASIQAAVNAVPATGGSVFVAPGTYPGPTSIPNNVNIIGYGGQLPAVTWNTNINNHLSIYPAVPADQQVIFTYTSGLTLTNLFNSKISNVTFDFGSSNSGITLLGSVGNEFEISIQNCGTGTALTLDTVSSGASAGNTIFNNFPRLFIANCAGGIAFSGSEGTYQANATDNVFGFVFMDDITATGINFIRQCDSNRFDYVEMTLNNSANGVVVNSYSPNTDVDAGGNHFGNLQVDLITAAGYTGTELTLNASINTTIDFLALNPSGSTGTEIVVNPSANVVNYNILGFEDFSGQNAQGIETTRLDVSGPSTGSNGLTFSENRLPLWSTYRGYTSQEYEIDDLSSGDASKHRFSAVSQANTDVNSKATSPVRLNMGANSGTGGTQFGGGGTSPTVAAMVNANGSFDQLGLASAPANPAFGYCRQYFNTTTGLMASINASGGSCAASGISYPPVAGVPTSTGTGWGTPYQVGLGDNDLVQLNSSGQLPPVSAANLTGFPQLNQNTSGYAAGLAGCPNPAAIAAGSICYSNGTTWNVLGGNTTGTALFVSEVSGVPSFTTPPGGGNVSNSGIPTAGQIAVFTSATVIQGASTLPSGAFPTLTGDVSNTGLATTVIQVNGAAVPASASLIASNGSHQFTAAALTSADVFVGNSSNLPVGVAVSGDVTMTNAGVFTVGGLLTKSIAALSNFSSTPYMIYNGTNWTGANPFASPTFTGTITTPFAGGGTQCLQVGNTGVMAANPSCGGGGGGGASFVLTAAAANTPSSGEITYTGTITGGGSNAYAGYTFSVTGFTNTDNNITGLVALSSTATTLVFTASGTNETHAGTATIASNYVLGPLTATTTNDVALINNTTGTLIADAGFGFPLANTHLANSTIGIAGTANQIASSTASPALGGSTTLSIANPFVFPGPSTFAVGTTSVPSFTVPSGSAVTSAAAGQFWNLSGILQMYDGSHTNSFTTIQAAVVTNTIPKFSGTAGLMAGSGLLDNATTITSTEPFTVNCSGCANDLIFTINSVALPTLSASQSGIGFSATTGQFQINNAGTGWAAPIAGYPAGTGVATVSGGTGWGSTYNASSPIPANFLASIPTSQLTGLVQNAQLQNPSTTVNGVVCTLGSTCTVSGGGGGSGQTNYPVADQTRVTPEGLSITAANTVANTVTATTLVGNSFAGKQMLGAGAMLPGTNGLKTLQFKGVGTVSTAASAPTLSITIVLGGVTVGTISVPVGGSLSAVAWTLDYTVTVNGMTTANVGGCVEFIGASNAPLKACSSSASATGLNFSTNQTMDVQATWGTASASNTITANSLTILPAQSL